MAYRVLSSYSIVKRLNQGETVHTVAYMYRTDKGLNYFPVMIEKSEAYPHMVNFHFNDGVKTSKYFIDLETPGQIQFVTPVGQAGGKRRTRRMRRRRGTRRR